MRKFTLAVAVGAAAVAVLVPAAAQAALADCADYKKATLIRVTELDCSDAQRVIKAWVKECKSADPCPIDVRLGSGETGGFDCKGKERKGNLAVTCNGQESNFQTKFKYPA